MSVSGSTVSLKKLSLMTVMKVYFSFYLMGFIHCNSILILNNAFVEAEVNGMVVFNTNPFTPIYPLRCVR